jgi:hypothetical protein
MPNEKPGCATGAELDPFGKRYKKMKNSINVKKFRLVFTLVFLFLTVVGCDYEGDEQRTKISQTLLQFKDAVNAGDRTALSKLISEDYDNNGQKKEEFVTKVLGPKILISGYNLGSLNLNEAKNKAFTVTEWHTAGGEVTVRVPIFQRSVPSVNTTLISRTRFYLQREEKDIWRIVRTEALDKSREGTYGVRPPHIVYFEYQPELPRRGQAVEVRIRMQKGEETNSVFLSVNGIPLGSYAQSGLQATELNDTFLQVFRIPEDFPENKDYTIEVLAFEGRIDPLQIYLSDMDGFHYKLLTLPVH